MSVVTSLNVAEFSQRRTQEKYPNLLLKSINETTPLIVSVLEKGEIPVIALHNEEKRVVGYMCASAINIDKLIRTHKEVIYNVSEEKSKELQNVADYLEVVLWTC